MTGPDEAGLRFVQRLHGTAEILDWVLRLVLEQPLLKMGPPVMLLLFVWLRPEGRVRPQIGLVVRGVVGVVLALALGRVLQDHLPPRPRPRMVLPELPWPALSQPFDHDWSSFPSDNAALAFAMAAVVLAASRPLGLLALGWAAAGVAFPRLYFGYHHLTDLLAGAGLGAGVTLLALRLPLPEAALARLRALEARLPVIATLALFVLGVEIILLFQTTRALIEAARDLGRALGVWVRALGG